MWGRFRKGKSVEYVIHSPGGEPGFQMNVYSEQWDYSRSADLTVLRSTASVNPAFLLYFCDPFVDHLVVFTGGHFGFRFFCPGGNAKH